MIGNIADVRLKSLDMLFTNGYSNIKIKLSNGQESPDLNTLPEDKAVDKIVLEDNAVVTKITASTYDNSKASTCFINSLAFTLADGSTLKNRESGINSTC